MRETLPAELRPLIEAGRRQLAARGVALDPSFDTVGGGAGCLDPSLVLRHGMLAWMADPQIDALRHGQMLAALDGVGQLFRVLNLLADAQIECVSLKGPALSSWLYGDVAARPFSDLDILVSEREFARALARLRSAGYTPKVPDHTATVIYGRIGAWPLVRPGSLPIDLHWRPAGHRFGAPLDARQVLAGRTFLSLSGREVPVPAPTHVAVLLLMHAAKHLWYGLDQVQSVAAIATTTDVDWQEVHRLLAAAGVRNAGAAGLLLAAQVFGVDVPAPFVGDLTRPEVGELVRCGYESLGLPPGQYPARGLDRRMQRLCFDARVARWRFELLRLVEPTQAESEWLPLPAPLTIMYWPLRLVRVAAISARLTATGSRGTR